MARDDVFLVRHSGIPPIGEGQPDRAIINRFGALIVVDLYTQLLLSGFCFHMQTGTEDAPITTNGPLDDTKPVIVADCNSGAMMPLLFEVNTVAHSTSTLIAAMLEADMDKLRSELETERALVARLHQAKLGLERRAADAEAELEHQRTRRSSVIRRLLGAEKQ